MSKSRKEIQTEKQEIKKNLERVREKRYNKERYKQERAEAQIMLQVYSALGYIAIDF